MHLESIARMAMAKQYAFETQFENIITQNEYASHDAINNTNVIFSAMWFI